MVKFKAKIKNGQLVVKAKLGSSDEVNEREINSLFNRPVRGLLKPEKKKTNQIVYTGVPSVSLYERLKRPVTQHEFFSIMSQITELVRTMRNSNLSMDNLHLDMRLTFINEKTDVVQLIYMPLITQHIRVDIIGFMESITYMAIPTTDQNREYISKYMMFLRGLKGFDTDKIENYIAKVDSSLVNKGNISGDDLLDNTTVLNIIDEDNLPETMVLEQNPDDMGETALLAENAAMPVVKYPYMVRIATDDKFEINKPVYRIGKEQSYVDYFVANNNKVSRSHANIVTGDGRYFIKDLNSTNGTYVNGRIISVEKEFEIFDKDEIKLANEEFVFYIE